MLTERVSNLSMGLALLLSFVVLALCFSYFATVNTGPSDIAAERDPAIRKAGHGSPNLSGS